MKKQNILYFWTFLAIFPLVAKGGTWINDGIGNWTDISNWNGGISDSWAQAIINNGGTAVLNEGEEGIGSTIFVGTTGNGNLILNNGTVNASWNVIIAEQTGSTGFVQVNGGKITNAYDNNFVVGKGGNGTLEVNKDGEVVSDWTFIGGEIWRNALQASGTGTVILNETAYFNNDRGIVLAAGATSEGTFIVNDNSRVNTKGALNIGYDGKGEFTVNGGLVSTPTGATWLGTNAGSVGTLNLNGGILETNQLSGYDGQAYVTFNGGTLKALANNSNFINKINTITLGNNGGIIDTNGKNVSANSAFSGQGGLTKINSGTLTLNASSNIGTLTHSGGTVVIASGQSINVDRATTIAGGSVLQLNGAANLTTGSLIFNDAAQLVLNPLVSDLHAVSLDLGNLNGGKVGITILDFAEFDIGESLTVFTFDSMVGDYGFYGDAGKYFEFVNGDGDKYFFSWDDSNNALLLVRELNEIPEPSSYAIFLGLSMITASVSLRRKRK